MKVLHLASLGLFGWMLGVAPAAADVKLTMANGRVTLVAKDATLRQILTEWARVGQTKIVNLERIPGGPVSMELNDIPEAQALDVLLRSVAGYLAAPRPVDAANLSHFDRIVVMPTSAAPRPTTGPAPAPPPFVQPQPQFAQPMPADDEDPAVGTGLPLVVPNRGPVFNAPQPPQIANPQNTPNGVPFDAAGAARGGAAPPTPATPATVPGLFPRAGPAPSGAGGGVSVPGMIVQPPQPAPGTQPATPGTGRGGSGGR
jgi:hypothetical protein